MDTFTGSDIRKMINQNNLTIQKLFNPNQFTLNEGVQTLLDENAHLRSICKHEFENGVCIYCDTKENEV